MISPYVVPRPSIMTSVYSCTYMMCIIINIMCTYIYVYIYIIVLYYIYIYIILYIVLCYIYIYIYYLFTYLCILMHTYAAHSATMVLQSVVHNLIRLCIAKCCVENAQVAAQGVLIHFLRLCQNWVQVQLPVSLHQTYIYKCKLTLLRVSLM